MERSYGGIFFEQYTIHTQKMNGEEETTSSGVETLIGETESMLELLNRLDTSPVTLNMVSIILGSPSVSSIPE